MRIPRGCTEYCGVRVRDGGKRGHFLVDARNLCTLGFYWWLRIAVDFAQWVQGGAFLSRSSSWENCELAFSSSPMTPRNSGPPADTAQLPSPSPSMLQVRTVLALLAGMLVEGPYLSRNSANPMRKSSNPALKSFHSCEVVGCGIDGL